MEVKFASRIDDGELARQGKYIYLSLSEDANIYAEGWLLIENTGASDAVLQFDEFAHPEVIIEQEEELRSILAPEGQLEILLKIPEEHKKAFLDQKLALRICYGKPGKPVDKERTRFLPNPDHARRKDMPLRLFNAPNPPKAGRIYGVEFPKEKR